MVVFGYVKKCSKTMVEQKKLITLKCESRYLITLFGYGKVLKIMAIVRKDQYLIQC